MVKMKKSRIAWGLAVLLAVLLVSGVGLVLVRMGPDWEVKYAVSTNPGGYVWWRTTSPVRTSTRWEDRLTYVTTSPTAREVLRVGFIPRSVTAGGRPLQRLPSAAALDRQEGYVFERAGGPGGALWIRHDRSGEIAIRWK
jgi:hypothetical protein